MGVDTAVAVLFLGLLPMGLVWWGVRRLRRLSAPEVLPEADERPVVLSCPGCGARMRPGFVLAGRGIVWRDADSARFSPFTTIFGSLENTVSLSFRPGENRAWRCPDCRLLTIDHSRILANRPQ